MHEQAAQARFQRLHEDRPWHDGTFSSWQEKPDADHPYHFTHGTTVWVADVDHGHGGDFLTDESPGVLAADLPGKHHD